MSYNEFIIIRKILKKLIKKGKVTPAGLAVFKVNLE